MAMLEQATKWTLTSTGTGKFLSIGPAQSVTFGIETSSGCTATVQILHRMGTTGGGFASVLSTNQCTLAALVTDQFLGPLEYVAPRVVDKTAGGTTNVVTVYVRSA